MQTGLATLSRILDDFWTWPSHVLPPAWPLGLFVRALGLIYVVAFASLLPQIVGLAGSRGITPVTSLLNAIRRDFPGFRRYAYFPTLLWLDSGDRALRGILWAGVASGCAVVVGGPHTPFALLLCFVLYLSLDLPVQVTFPWDCLLLEAGFLAVFLPPLRPLPEIAAVAPPPVLVVFALQFLTFRVLFGFGKEKFFKSTRKDLTYLQAFVINQPIPTRVAFLIHRAPVRLLQALIVGMFFAEIINPFLIFLPGAPRVLAAIVIGGLMIGIQLTGNFGFFNLLTLSCCLPLLDARTPFRDLTLAELAGSPFAVLRSVVVAGLVLGGILNLPLNSWTRSWFYWVSLERFRSPLFRGVVRLLRFLGPFRLSHAYGVFPPHSGPSLHWTPVFEGTADGVTWEEYEYRYVPFHPASRPRFVAPHHPRLDHFVIYEGYGVGAGTLGYGGPALGLPYSFARYRQPKRIMQRLLECEPSVARLFGKAPFSEGRPPIKIRMRMYALSPTTPEERAQTGNWWHRHEIGEHLPEVGRDDEAWNRWPPTPDQFHWDALLWRRRTGELARLWEEAARCVDACALVQRTAPPRLAPMVDELFTDFLPAAYRHGADWTRIAEVRDELLRRFSPEKLDAFERVLRRLAYVLAARLHPYWQRAASPALETDYFRLGLLAQHIIAKGRGTLDEVMRDPSRAAAYLAEMSVEEGGFLTILWNHEEAITDARKWRLREVSLTPPEDKLMAIVSGSFVFQRIVSERFPQTREENLPAVSRLIDTGEWRAPFDEQPEA